MRNSERPPSLGQQAAEILAGMSKEEFLSAIEERCPELIHGQGPRPGDAMVPGPRHDSGPSLQQVWEARRKSLAAREKGGKPLTANGQPASKAEKATKVDVTSGKTARATRSAKVKGSSG